jgi:RNA polymerase-binding protein DksA
MQTAEYEAFARELRRRRAALLKEFGHTENDLHTMGEERESEWTETAVEEQQRHLLTNLDSRTRETLGEMNAALQRIDDGSYGSCARCHVPIPFARLQAVPTTRFCAACAEDEIKTSLPATDTDDDETPQSGPIPADLALFTDEEIEEEMWEHIHNDGRVESEELNLTCRQGVVFLNGALPSRAQHSILLQLITDVLGFQEVVDRIEVEQLAWQREDRDKEPAAAADMSTLEEKEESSRELYGSEDIIESEGEVLTEPAPLGQPAPEEE